MGHTLDSFAGGSGGREHITLHICARFVLLIQGFLLRLGQGHGHGDVCLPTGRKGYGTAVQALQKQISVIGGHIPAAVQVGVIQRGNFLPVAGGVVQKCLGIVPVDGSIAIKVHVDEAIVHFHGFAVHRPGNVRIQGDCSLAQIPSSLKLLPDFIH